MTNKTKMEERFGELLTLVREGHEAVINEEEVKEYHAKLKTFIRSVVESAREEERKVILQTSDTEYIPPEEIIGKLPDGPIRIADLIKEARAEERKRIMEWVENHEIGKLDPGNGAKWDEGYNAALSDLKTFLEQK